MPYGTTKLLAALFLFLGWRIGRNYGKCFPHSETLISHVHLKLHLVKVFILGYYYVCQQLQYRDYFLSFFSQVTCNNTIKDENNYINYIYIYKLYT